MTQPGGRSAVFYRQPKDNLPSIVRGEGYHLWDAQGHRVVDLASGISTTASIGQGRSEIADAMAEQARQLAFIHNSWVTNEKQEELAARYASLAPDGVSRVMFSSGGSEANELSLRIARQYHLARDEPERTGIISLSPSYHGATMGALSMTGRDDVNGDYQPFLLTTTQVGPPVLYRGPYRDLDPKDAANRSSDALLAAVTAQGPETFAALIVEPVSPSAGMMVPDPTYWQQVRKICDRFGILLIADEIVTGAGRCGYFLAMEHFGVTADLTNLGKGLTGGYAPLAATLIKDHVADTIWTSGRGVAAVHTYSGNPIGCAVGLAVLDVIEREGLFERSRHIGAYAKQLLAQELADSPLVGEIRGLGLSIGIEYVQSKKGRQRFPESAKLPLRLWDAMWSRGFLLRTLHHGSALVGDCTNFVPALTIEEADLERAVEALKDSLQELERGLARSTQTP